MVGGKKLRGRRGLEGTRTDAANTQPPRFFCCDPYPALAAGKRRPHQNVPGSIPIRDPAA